MKPPKSNKTSAQRGKERDIKEERKSLLPPSSERVVFSKLVYPSERVELENLYQKLKVERAFYRNAKPKPIR